MSEPNLFVTLLRAIFGCAVLLGVAWLFSQNRKAIPWRLVAVGCVLQLIVAALALRVPGTRQVMEWFSAGFVGVLSFSMEGVRILMGPLAEPAPGGVVLAFQLVGTIVFFSALTSLLYYLRILQWVVYGIAWVMKRSMRLSGPESLATAANIFLGQTEAPLLVKPYLKDMTRSEIMLLMTGGMATIAGSVLGAYVTFLGGDDPVQRTYMAQVLLTASFMSAPAAVVISKMMVPETEKVNEALLVPRDQMGENVFDAVTQGASDGLKLTLNVAAMIIAFVGLIQLFNWMIAGVGGLLGLNALVSSMSGGMYTQFDLKVIAAYLFAPVAWIIGIDGKDVLISGEILGVKHCFNEFIAYMRLQEWMAAPEGKPDGKTVFLLSFALCGFANFGSIGIQIGGIGTLAPEQRGNLARLGMPAMIAGALASLMTAAIAAVFYAA